jgi:hypothetical protein
MNKAYEELKTAFIEDHRELSQGYVKLLQLLEKKELAKLIKESRRFDAMAGPHIAFEETFLYPILVESFGVAYVNNLMAEHSEVLVALLSILKLDANAPLSDKKMHELQESLKRGLEHSESCGSLISYLKVLNTERQKKLLSDLLLFRQLRTSWSELKRL